jgi:hypothetical protein
MNAQMADIAQENTPTLKMYNLPFQINDQKAHELLISHEDIFWFNWSKAVPLECCHTHCYHMDAKKYHRRSQSHHF